MRNEPSLMKWVKLLCLIVVVGLLCWIAVSVFSQKDLTKEIPIGRIKAVTANYNDQRVAEMLDRDEKTRWTSGAAQKEGMEIRVEFIAETVVSEVYMQSLINGQDYPREVLIRYSRDGKEWKISEILEHNLTRYKFKPVSCKFLSILQTGTNNRLYWGIDELFLYGL